MRPDIRVREIPVIRAEIYLRPAAFERMTSALGATTDAARAELIDMSERQVSRARTKRVGETLVARTLAGLRRHEKTLRKAGLRPTFEELFEIRELAA